MPARDPPFAAPVISSFNTPCWEVGFSSFSPPQMVDPATHGPRKPISRVPSRFRNSRACPLPLSFSPPRDLGCRSRVAGRTAPAGMSYVRQGPACRAGHKGWQSRGRGRADSRQTVRGVALTTALATDVVACCDGIATAFHFEASSLLDKKIEGSRSRLEEGAQLEFD
ncbi:hypothetical protein GGTG_07275 [Gaeumannomyces tritici R3-111a-1]|uniref:Uncharacterized protein n=1 Tax=Gaeumannomyces tritici (strain R3-111a-1) TaxID=644352 RepID=J3P178_GAET3|nr:hypothetical protein GGTG_07275 [Gaeumannomyces tritici R3-111a-1]EJT77363.1 hypothetical protein GGTG_07275 [Gaeumannomyces tritici R3-111a-1]